MQMTLLGAAGGDVTGSAYLLEAPRARVLVDFGLFQGRQFTENRNKVPRALKPGKLDAVLLTHAHLDHVGRLPLLIKQGFGAPIYATPATIDLAELILRDAAKIQANDAERINRKRERAGQQPIEPLFRIEDVERLLKLFKPVPYEQPVAIAAGITARWIEAGHMLGSASIELTAQDADRSRTVVFSGDIGPRAAPILRDPSVFTRADLVIMESTYGDRDHKPLDQTLEEFHRIILQAVAHKGKILVPTFAIGRAQQMQYHLAQMFHQKLAPPFPIYLDSPMAIEANSIYLRHEELLDEEALAMLRSGDLLRDLASLHLSQTADDSKALNYLSGPCLILAGAGMCNAGRILHHLKQNLWKPQTAVLIVGYQAPGSLGRLLIEGRKQVSIYGEKIAVEASIHTLGGFSAHAGQTDLLAWLKSLVPVRPRVILTHGEDRGRKPLARLIRDRFGLDAELSFRDQIVNI